MESNSHILLCPTCGYDLTAPTGPVCPECGGPSDAGAPLRGNRPARFPVTACMLAGKQCLLGAAFAFFYTVVWHNGASTTYASPTFWVVVLGAMIAAVCVLLGGLCRNWWIVRLAATIEFLIAALFLMIGTLFGRSLGLVIAYGLVALHICFGIVLLKKISKANRSLTYG